MFNGDELVEKVPSSSKKSFSMGVVIPHKMRNCSKCAENFLCEGCDKLVNQTKEFSANVNDLKQQAPNNIGHMLPKLVTICCFSGKYHLRSLHLRTLLMIYNNSLFF